MDNETPEDAPKQVCSIRIMFQTDTDDDAIDIKKQIGQIVSAIPSAHVAFSLATNPVKRQGMDELQKQLRTIQKGDNGV